jgi:hypothetical protein
LDALFWVPTKLAHPSIKALAMLHCEHCSDRGRTAQCPVPAQASDSGKNPLPQMGVKSGGRGTGGRQRERESEIGREGHLFHISHNRHGVLWGVCSLLPDLHCLHKHYEQTPKTECIPSGDVAIFILTKTSSSGNLHVLGLTCF